MGYLLAIPCMIGRNKRASAPIRELVEVVTMVHTHYTKLMTIPPGVKNHYPNSVFPEYCVVRIPEDCLFHSLGIGPLILWESDHLSYGNRAIYPPGIGTSSGK